MSAEVQALADRWPSAETQQNGMLRPEHATLLSCARTTLRPQDRHRLAELLEQDLDFGFLFAEAQRHGLIPLLLTHVESTCPELLPEPHRRALEASFSRNTISNMLLTSEMCSALRLFEQNGIAAAALKGATLAMSVYGDVALRQFADVDILVRLEDTLRAKELLVANGYTPEISLTREQELAHLKIDCEVTFRRNIYLELQWEVVPARYGCRINREQLWNRLESVAIAGSSVPVLAKEDLLLMLCIHGTKHCWERLAWICDVSELVRARPDMNWDFAFQQAAAIGCQRMLLVGLALAKNLLDCDLPAEVEKKIEIDGRISSLVDEVSHRLFKADGQPASVVKNSLFFVRSRERLRDRAGCLAGMLTMPSVNDLRSMSIAPSLFPLYALLRPMRLIAKHVFGRFRSPDR